MAGSCCSNGIMRAGARGRARGGAGAEAGKRAGRAAVAGRRGRSAVCAGARRGRAGSAARGAAEERGAAAVCRARAVSAARGARGPAEERGAAAVCRAARPEEGAGAPPSIAGMDASRGYFGFVPFSELWVGRWAMIGFASGLFAELATGKGILKQIGIQTPSTPVFIALAALIGGSTLVASGRTVARLLSGSMSDAEVRDYASFLGLKGENRSTKSRAAEIKAAGDFTSLNELPMDPSDTATAADEFLSQDSAADIGAAKGALGAGVVADSGADASDPIDSYFARSEAAEAAYAKDVEMTNGRQVCRRRAHHVTTRCDAPTH